jgi:hypothetical protein
LIGSTPFSCASSRLAGDQMLDSNTLTFNYDWWPNIHL